jgi:hypothetical protein
MMTAGLETVSYVLALIYVLFAFVSVGLRGGNVYVAIKSELEHCHRWCGIV